MTSRDIPLSLRVRVRPLPGVRVSKMPGIPEWLLTMDGVQGRNCLLDADTVWTAIYDKVHNLVPEGGFNHGMGEFWELVDDHN